MSTKIAVFASGGGSNAQKIFDYFQNHTSIDVVLCVVNKESAGVISKANKMNIEVAYFSNEAFKSGALVLDKLRASEIDIIVLAGFLRKIPNGIIESFENRIINIHPSLLPKYGGKGMYGMYVHKAVKENNESFSGPTIHLVNEKFDDGRMLAQFQVKLETEDSAEDIAKKVLALEHRYYAKVIEAYIEEINN